MLNRRWRDEPELFSTNDKPKKSEKSEKAKDSLQRQRMLTIKYGDCETASPRSATRISAILSLLAPFRTTKSADKNGGIDVRASATKTGFDKSAREYTYSLISHPDSRPSFKKKNGGRAKAGMPKAN